MARSSVVLYALTVTCLVGCATVQEPKSGRNTLVIGQITQIASNYPSYGEASVNGVTKVSIELTFKNLTDNTVHVVKSSYGGIFFSQDMSPGKYRIMQIFDKVEIGGAWAAVYSSRASYFDVQDNSVSNLGLIYWICDYGAATKYHQSSGYAEVRDRFKKDHSDSGWNNMEWKEIRLTY
jgi:hypothetical protein